MVETINKFDSYILFIHITKTTLSTLYILSILYFKGEREDGAAQWCIHRNKVGAAAQLDAYCAAHSLRAH